MKLITEVVCNWKTIQNLHLPPSLDNKTIEALAVKFVCTDTEVTEFVWVLDKQRGCAYLMSVWVCICLCVCVRDRLDSPPGKSWQKQSSDQVPA